MSRIWAALDALAHHVRTPFPVKTLPTQQSGTTLTASGYFYPGTVLLVDDGRSTETVITGITSRDGPHTIPVASLRWWNRIHLVPASLMRWVCDRYDRALGVAETELYRR